MTSDCLIYIQWRTLLPKNCYKFLGSFALAFWYTVLWKLSLLKTERKRELSILYTWHKYINTDTYVPQSKKRKVGCWFHLNREGFVLFDDSRAKNTLFTHSFQHSGSQVIFFFYDLHSFMYFSAVLKPVITWIFAFCSCLILPGNWKKHGYD